VAVVVSLLNKQREGIVLYSFIYYNKQQVANQNVDINKLIFNAEKGYEPSSHLAPIILLTSTK